jgi:integration host factor subunit beta
MHKSELTRRLIEHLSEKHLHLTDSAVKESVDVIIQRIIDSLLQGTRMELRGFGSLDLRYFPSREARNPKTGKSVEMSGRHRLHFKPAKKLKLRLNASYR